jgi:alpha-glucosidase
MRYLLLFLLLVHLPGVGAPRPFRRTITSPDGRIALTVTVTDSTRYAVTYAGQPLLNPSAVAMTLADGRSLAVGAVVRRSSVRSVRDSIVPPVVTKRRLIRDHFTELTLGYAGNYALLFRVYDDGVAYRFQTSLPDSLTIRNETARFALVNNPTVYFPAVQKRQDADHFHTSFEEPYSIVPLSQMHDTTLAFSPVLVAGVTPNPRIVITESDIEDYPGMFLAKEGLALKGVFAPVPLAERMTDGEFPQLIVTRRADFIARTVGKRSFPWRVLVIGPDKRLPETDLVYRLAAPSRVRDVSWVQPGKCTDEWITNINLFNVPFRAGINTATYKYYIDFAKRFGLDRILLDAGWSDYKDLFKINPELNMTELAAYAKAQGIKLSMWTLCSTLDRQLEPALKHFNDWGVDFIMTDFMDRDDQKTVQFYTRIAEACARHRIMIMFHGAYKSAGFERTWPNAITREGVLGSEYNMGSNKASPGHDVLLPFIRMVGGPMDYEPGMLENVTKEQFKPIFGKVMSQGTRCHQLAMFVVYDSPMPIFAGNPAQAYLEPAFMEFLGTIPAAFDETTVVDAQLGEYIVTARRKGTDWYVGGMTNWTARDLTLPLDFLGDDTYEATLCRDGINADRNPVDYQVNNQTLRKTDSLPIHLAPGGGFVLRLRKK